MYLTIIVMIVNGVFFSKKDCSGKTGIVLSFYHLKSYIRIINIQVEQSKTTYNANTIHE